MAEPGQPTGKANRRRSSTLAAVGQACCSRENRDICCCTPDDNEGFDLLGCVIFGRQLGTAGCCIKDKDGHCFGCVMCECQFDCLFPCVLVGAILSGALCCPAGNLRRLGIPATAAGLDATSAATDKAGVVAGAQVGGLMGCCKCCSITQSACCMLFFCPCVSAPCYYADNAALVDGPGPVPVSSWSVDCAACCLFGLCGCAWCITSTKRTEMRYALGLKADAGPCGDGCTHFWCMPCALVEERKILHANGCSREYPAVRRFADLTGGGQQWSGDRHEALPRAQGVVVGGKRPVTKQPSPLV